MPIRYKMVKAHEIPPGGWRYVQEDTNFSWDSESEPIFGKSLDAAAAIVAAHREGNDLEPGDAWQEVLDFTARAMKPAERKQVFREDKARSETAKKTRLKRSADIRRAGIEALASIAARKAAGLPVHVALLPAFRRANICRQCPHNQLDVEKSLLAKFEDSILRKALGPRELPVSMRKDLGACDVCTCENSTSVWYEKGVFSDGPAVPKNCWKHADFAE